MTDVADRILSELEPLFKEAKEKKLWFYCSYQQMWFSPKQLRERHAQGNFIWGKINWELRDPQEKIEELVSTKRGIEKAIIEIQKEILENSK